MRKTRRSGWESDRERRFLQDMERQRQLWRGRFESNPALCVFCFNDVFDWFEPAPKLNGPEEVAILSPQFPDIMGNDGGVQKTFNILWAVMRERWSVDDPVPDLRPSPKICLAPGAWHAPGMSWVVLKECYDERPNVQRFMSRPTNPAAVLAYLIDRAREILRTRPPRGFNLPGYLGFDPRAMEYRLGLRFWFDPAYRRYVLAAVDPEEMDPRFVNLLPAGMEFIR